MLSLKEMREELNKPSDSSGNYGDGGALFRHWNLPDNGKATVRFLPDADETNKWFWIEEATTTLWFPGIAGGDEDNRVMVKIPCMKSWGQKTCPILTKIKPWWKRESADEKLDAKARKVYPKKNFFFQGFIRGENMLEDEDRIPENPIRRFSFNRPIFDIIKTTLASPEDFDELPTDYDEGTDFRLNRTWKSVPGAPNGKGGYANFDTSMWARKTTPLTDEEREAIEKYDLFDLSTFRSTKPTEQNLAVVGDMIDASLNEELYEPELWGDHFRPIGVRLDEGTTAAKSKKGKKVSADDDGDGESESADADDDEDDSVKVEKSDSGDGKKKKKKAKKPDDSDGGKKKKKAKKPEPEEEDDDDGDDDDGDDDGDSDSDSRKKEAERIIAQINAEKKNGSKKKEEDDDDD